MKIRVHRGTQEIGGNCIELEASGRNLVLDIGAPLETGGDDPALPDVTGITSPSPGFCGVLLSHTHGDHSGLLPLVPPTTQVYVGERAWRVMTAASPFLRKPLPSLRIEFYAHRKEFVIGPFRITPFLNDHSAFDAYSFLIEADNQRIFYTGDFRTHGKRSWIFESFASSPPDNIDVLLTEGTNIGRRESVDPETEEELQARITKTARKTKGIVLAMFSPLNIDRLVVFARAAHDSGRTMVLDAYAASVIEAADVKSLTAIESQTLVFVSKRQRQTIISKSLFPFTDRIKRRRIYDDQISENPSKYILMFRDDYPPLFQPNTFRNGLLVYSMWPGYLSRGSQRLQEWAESIGLPIEVMHTSGHASISGLQRLERLLQPRTVIPIHTNAPERFKEHLPNVRTIMDHQWYHVAGLNEQPIQPDQTTTGTNP